jgi:hypothetical protein
MVKKSFVSPYNLILASCSRGLVAEGRPACLASLLARPTGDGRASLTRATGDSTSPCRGPRSLGASLARATGDSTSPGRGRRLGDSWRSDSTEDPRATSGRGPFPPKLVISSECRGEVVSREFSMTNSNAAGERENEVVAGRASVPAAMASEI